MITEQPLRSFVLTNSNYVGFGAIGVKCSCNYDEKGDRTFDELLSFESKEKASEGLLLSVESTILIRTFLKHAVN